MNEQKKKSNISQTYTFASDFIYILDIIFLITLIFISNLLFCLLLYFDFSFVIITLYKYLYKNTLQQFVFASNINNIIYFELIHNVDDTQITKVTN
jgi:hypothetical protein